MVKFDQLSLGGGGGVAEGGRGVPASLAKDLSDIKTTENNILHQITDLR